MIESLTDQWMRADAKLACAPGYLMSELVRQEVADEFLQWKGPSGFSRVRSLEAEDPVLVRAMKAETEVWFRWGVTEGHAYKPPESTDTDKLVIHRNSAIANWSAKAIMGRSIEVPALEAEPTLAQIADWMERFSRALMRALARVEMTRVPTRILDGFLSLRAEQFERRTRAPEFVPAGTSSLELKPQAAPGAIPG